MDEKIIESSDTKKKNRIPKGQHETDKFPVLHAGSVPEIDVLKWKFKIYGLVEKERELTYDEFTSLPQVKVFSDIHCVTGWSKLNNTWEGVSANTIKELVKIRPEAKYVIIHAEGGFTANLNLSDFFQPDVLFALKYGNKILEKEHGYPLRLVVPRLYFWKSAKWVNGIEFVKEDKRGFWESRGYHNHGDPWKEERYSGASGFLLKSGPGFLIGLSVLILLLLILVKPELTDKLLFSVFILLFSWLLLNCLFKLLKQGKLNALV